MTYISDERLNVLHSGNVGDIIYSIPVLLGILKQRGIEKVNYHLKLNVPMGYSAEHPLGNVLLNLDFASKLLPLLKKQKYIDKVKIYENQHIDINLDNFRQLPIRFQTGVIPRWYFWQYGVDFDLTQSWIEAEKFDYFKNKIIVSRTQRHNSPFINYKFMDRFSKDIVFVGVEKEFQNFKQQCPNCNDFVKFDNFLDMANAFNSCKFFVGNQGFPFTLAEAMKINRLLEANNDAPNNIPFTQNGKDALFQEHFEKWFNYMNLNYE